MATAVWADWYDRPSGVARPSFHRRILKVFRVCYAESFHLVTLVPVPTVAAPFLAMTKDGTCSFAYHGPSGAFVRGWKVPSKRDGPAYPHNSQASEETSPQATVCMSADVQVDLINHNSSLQSGPNQGSYGNSAPQNESFENAVRGPSLTARARLSDEMVRNFDIAGTRRCPDCFDRGLDIHQRCGCRDN